MDDRAERMDIDNREASQVKTRGRGFASKDDTSATRHRRGDRMDEDVATGLIPQRSIEGWILMVRNVNPEADEESLLELFSEYGTVKNMHLNLDRRTGFVKGYALVEYETLKEAETAIHEGNGVKFYEETLKVGFAFTKTDEPAQRSSGRRRDRSLSPGR